MAVLVRCGACGAEFRADSKHRGKETQCGKCHQPILIDGAAIADYDVFISYSNVDKQAADAVCASLEAKKWRCWIAPRDVLPGSEWGAAIVSAIEQSRLMVLVYSSHANSSQQVIREVERAVNKAVPIIPFRIEAVPPSKNMEYFLSASHWMDAMTKPMEEHLDELGRVIKALWSMAISAPLQRRSRGKVQIARQ
jgi:DNA-directed RNA polymerase subunit RPC12/RpoP